MCKLVFQILFWIQFCEKIVTLTIEKSMIISLDWKLLVSRYMICNWVNFYCEIANFNEIDLDADHFCTK